MTDLTFPDYDQFLAALKQRIRTAQVKAALAVNQELVMLYWQIGREILERQQQQGWGAKVVERLSKDLRQEFPEMKGLSRSNLLYMRAFAEAYPDEQIVQQVVGRIPWGHNVRLLDRLGDATTRLWYAQMAIAQGWSRNALELQIENQLYERQGAALTNFTQALPPPQSDLAQQILKDPYNFDFLSLGAAAQERDFENALLEHIRKFLLELGVGFTFVGNQYHLEIGGQDFYIDLLFYHLKLRCFVVIDLKMEAFKPSFSGQISFYVSAVDDLLRHPDDQPTIGLVLCKSRNQTIVEYALRDLQKPVGVATYRLGQGLPANLEGSLPSIEQLEAALNTVETHVDEPANPSDDPQA
jgi:predicted nuclease of restriction endonuclease-like (RecB) superfamily